MEALKSHAIVKTHELALKGKNRPWFMRKLTDNLRTATRGSGVERVWQGQLMVGLTLEDEDCWPEVKSRLKDVFGVAKFYKAYDLPQDLDGLKARLPELLEGRSFESFRITTNRADKRFPLNSKEVNRDLGAFVKDLTGAQVKLKDPDLSIYLDIQTKGFLVYFDEVKAHGGLPVGVSGKVAVMLSGGIDSPVAAWQMMKRGCQAMFVHFHSYPLVDRTSMEKARRPTGWCYIAALWSGSQRSWPDATAPRPSSPARVAGRWPPRPWRISPWSTSRRACPYSGH